jgi:4-hydroxybenzoate polyprenyltransferase
MSDSGQNIPLVCDLDGTLIRTDTLFEAFLILLKTSPFSLFILPFWLIKGKANLKSQIFSRVDISPEPLPYNHDVLDFLKSEKLSGRKIILATASHISIANRIADYLNIFDDVLATTDSLNLIGKNKADILSENYGEGGFDYIGDHRVDIHIWEKSNSALIVEKNDSLSIKAKNITNVTKIFKLPQNNYLKSLIKQIRVYQWVKNILLFLPIFMAHKVAGFDSLLTVLFGFFAFSLTASSVYLTNDLLDLESDRCHPRKKFRPLASGEMSIIQGIFLAKLFFVLGFLIAYFSLPIDFFITLAIYYLITTLYSFWLKRLVLIDIFTLAALYTIRIIAGGTASGVEISPWLLAFSMFIFLSLALVKRYTELLNMISNKKETISGRGYKSSDSGLILALGGAASYSAILVFSLYANSSQVASLYQNPQYMWLVAVLLLYWISRIWLLAHRGQMSDDPIVFTAKDKSSWIICILIIILAFFAK